MYMPLWAQLLIAGVVSLGVIVVARAIIVGLIIGSRPTHPNQPSGSPTFQHPFEQNHTQSLDIGRKPPQS
jgi:hypothetical protein